MKLTAGLAMTNIHYFIAIQSHRSRRHCEAAQLNNTSVVAR